MSRRPGVVIWFRSMGDIRGGAETHALRLAGLMQARDIRVMLVVGNTGWQRGGKIDLPVRQQIIPIWRLPSVPLPVMGPALHYLLLFVYLLIYARRYPTFHINSIARKTIPAIIIGRMLGKRMVLRAIGADYRDEMPYTHPRLLRWHIRLLRMGHLIIAQSSQTAAILREMRIETPLVTIPNGIDTHHFCPADAALKQRRRQQLNLPESGHILMWVGGLRAEKRADVALLALHQLAESHPNLYLVFVGEGPERERIRDLIASCNLDGRVILAGWAGDTRDYLQVADVYCLTSDQETHSNALLEAMAVGLPVIATQVGGNLDSIKPGVNGLLFPVGDSAALADAVQTVLADTALRARLGAAARDHVQQVFSAEQMVEAYLRAYQIESGEKANA